MEKPAASLPAMRRALLAWYDLHRRDLPWRRDSGLYPVWVSEIMLQQTRVAAVVEHYARFMKRFPTVQVLAAAREQSVLAQWSGLGYYHRARRMHQAAKIISRERHGEFPRTAEAWRELPGIGRYTAAAIASIALGEVAAVVDGNVERVLGRLFGTMADKEEVWRRAEQLLSHERPGDFNQAMMELGATVCTPRAPQCLVCPMYLGCGTRGALLSAPQAPRKRQQVRYALARRGDSILLVLRPPEASLMAGMWELPQARDKSGAALAKFRHSITDTDYEVSVVSASPSVYRNLGSQTRWFTQHQWQKAALTGLARKILRHLAES